MDGERLEMDLIYPLSVLLIWLAYLISSRLSTDSTVVVFWLLNHILYFQWGELVDPVN